ncbi:MAG: response regulator transcription factor [Deltaproteobacteria bacterium]|nr:response regulator transcription factor [Deltaproteobacteria bacterium]
MPTNMIIADDHMLMREGLRSLLEKQQDIQVVGEASDGRTAVRMVQEKKPDLVIMDIGMPDLNGIEATRQIVESTSRTKVIALSMHSSERIVLEMLRAGASAYVLKLSAFEEVTRAVDAVIANKRYLSPSIAGVVIDKIMDQDSLEAPSAYSSLTPREREVLQLLAEGRNTKEIAFDLGISTRTVDVHRKNTMDKLSLYSVAELTRYALREGLIQN